MTTMMVSGEGETDRQGRANGTCAVPGRGREKRGWIESDHGSFLLSFVDPSLRIRRVKGTGTARRDGRTEGGQKGTEGKGHALLLVSALHCTAPTLSHGTPSMAHAICLPVCVSACLPLAAASLPSCVPHTVPPSIPPTRRHQPACPTLATLHHGCPQGARVSFLFFVLSLPNLRLLFFTFTSSPSFLFP